MIFKVLDMDDCYSIWGKAHMSSPSVPKMRKKTQPLLRRIKTIDFTRTYISQLIWDKSLNMDQFMPSDLILNYVGRLVFVESTVESHHLLHFSPRLDWIMFHVPLSGLLSNSFMRLHLIFHSTYFV